MCVAHADDTALKAAKRNIAQAQADK